MVQTLLFQNPKELTKYYRTRLSQMSMEELQSYQLASFQITKGKFKQYVQYNVKDTKEGLKCTKKILWYIKVPNTYSRARKDEVFMYMDSDLRKKHHKQEKTKVMDLETAFKEIKKLREDVSPTHRTGVRAY